jgi:hypothetical protein
VARVTVSTGVATFPVHAADAEMLVQRADGALYESKGAGRNRTTVAHPTMAEGADELLSELEPEPTVPVADAHLAEASTAAQQADGHRDEMSFGSAPHGNGQRGESQAPEPPGPSSDVDQQDESVGSAPNEPQGAHSSVSPNEAGRDPYEQGGARNQEWK